MANKKPMQKPKQDVPKPAVAHLKASDKSEAKNKKKQ